MKKVLSSKRICSLLLALLLCLSMFPFSASALSETPDLQLGQEDCEKSLETASRFVPNLITTDFTCNVYGDVIFTINNWFDTVDRIKVTISTVDFNGYKRSETFNFYNVPPLKSTYSAHFPQYMCTESLSVTYNVTDGTSEYGLAMQKGTRKIPESVMLSWSPGSFYNAETSINYHYNKHGRELGMSSVYSYCVAANSWRNNVTSADRVGYVSGTTPNVYRFKKSGLYIDLQGGLGGKIVSFGKAW